MFSIFKRLIILLGHGPYKNRKQIWIFNDMVTHTHTGHSSRVIVTREKQIMLMIYSPCSVSDSTFCCSFLFHPILIHSLFLPQGFYTCPSHWHAVLPDKRVPGFLKSFKPWPSYLLNEVTVKNCKISQPHCPQKAFLTIATVVIYGSTHRMPSTGPPV